MFEIAADEYVTGQDGSSGGADPRATLGRFANEHDQWVRLIVRHVLDTGEALEAGHIDEVYRHFRQEKALDIRTEPAVAPLTLGFSSLETAEPLTIDKLCEVTGVNALVAGAVIEPHEALTILFGENSTGKTGQNLQGPRRQPHSRRGNTRRHRRPIGSIAVSDCELPPRRSRQHLDLGG